MTDDRETGSGPGAIAVEVDAAQLAAPAPPERMRYRVGLEPEAVLERLRRVEDVATYRPGKFPDLGDPVPDRRFVAEVGERHFRIAMVGSGLGISRWRGRESSEVGAARGFGDGGGMLPTLELHGRVEVHQGTTEIDLRLVRQRSARSSHRWAGLVVLAVASAAWLVMGSGALAQRAVVLTVASLFLSPALGMDLVRAWRERRERLELLAFVERHFGPLALDDVEHSPYRNPRRPAPIGP